MRLRQPELASHPEVVVLGGGPAGAAAALLLAGRSHDVTLVCPESPPAATLGESIPPSARRVLQELDLLDSLRRASFEPNRGNSVWWAGRALRTEDFEEADGAFHVDRGGLERTLLSVAERHGVTVLRGVAARDVTEEPEGHRISCDGPDASFELRCRWVVDATGRRGLLSRSERRPDRDTTTLALVQRWRHPEGWPDARPGHTLVESYLDGWVWSIPLTPEVRCVTAMIDQRDPGVRGTSPEEMLAAELGKTTYLGPALQGADPVSDVWACPASLYTCARFSRSGLVVAGDAGSFIDPLSSFGVKKALSSGWLAGITVHTALADPDMEETALDFFDRREKEVYRRYRSASVPFFEEGAEAYQTGFWTRRAEAARRVGGARPGADDGDPDRLDDEIPRARVVDAYESIKARATLGAVPHPSARKIRRPAVEGHRIVLQDHLASDRSPHGLRYVRGVDLLALADIAPRHDDVPDGWAEYNAVAPPVTLPDYLTALATAFAAGLLSHEEG